MNLNERTILWRGEVIKILSQLLGDKLLALIAFFVAMPPFMYLLPAMCIKPELMDNKKFYTFSYIYMGIYLLAMISMCVIPDFWDWLL
jgi:hypothetical protein